MTGNKHVSQPVTDSAMFYLHSRSGMCQMMPSNQRSTKNGSSHPQKRRIARRFTYAVLCCAALRFKHARQPVMGCPIFYLHSPSPMCQMMPSNQRSSKNQNCHPQKRPITRWFTYAVLRRAVISHCCVAATSHERPLFVCQKCAKRSTSEAAQPQTQTVRAGQGLH